MRVVRLRHNAVHWSAAMPAEARVMASQRLMRVGIVAGLALCLACCSAVGYFLIR
ncbi:MAG: hypothetical protein WHX52_14065 [Anaerolineae bacterium]